MSGLIDRLPTEILEIMLIRCAYDYYCASGSPTPRPPSWVNVSYVSRHWRNVALNRPTLWTYLFVTSPRWTDVLLSRSKQASLKLHADLYDYEVKHYESCVEQVMNHLERIQELRLSLLFSWSSYHFVPQLSLASRAPRLQNLEIFAMDDSPGRRISSVLFDGGTPALRTLELSHCPVSWYSFKLSGLTTLSLGNVPVRFQQNTMEFLATLSCMQDLTHLYLNRSLTSAAGFLSSAALQAFRKFDLPHLSRLLIVAPLSTVIAFLSCVNIPLQTQVRLECYSEHDFSPEYYAPLSSLFSQRFGMSEDQAQSSQTIRPSVIEAPSAYDCGWEELKLAVSGLEPRCNAFFSTPYGNRDSDWDCNIPLQVIVFPDRSRPGNLRHIMSNICMLLTNVQSVHIFRAPYSLAFWSKAFGHLQGLRYLKLSDGQLPDLASVLSVTPPAGYTENKDGQADHGPYRELLAPALEELELYSILFISAADVGSLYDALSTRKGSRGQLRIVRCHVNNYGPAAELDMVGRWEDGHFHVVEERRGCHDVGLE